MIRAWTLDDTTGGYADLVSGATLSQTGTAPTTAAGVIGNAASFGGAGGLLGAASTAWLASGFAVEAWVYPTATPVAVSMLVAADASAGNRLFALYQNGGTGFGLISYNLNSTASSGITSAVAADTRNAWWHVVGIIVPDGATFRSRLYVNGSTVATSSTALASLATVALPVAIGYRTFSGFPDYFTGRIDEPRLWQFGAAGDPGAAFWTARYNAGAGLRP
jgi:hypothetical protein